MSKNLFEVKNSLVLTPIKLTTLLSPQAGDLACDIDDSNKVKIYDVTSDNWIELGLTEKYKGLIVEEIIQFLDNKAIFFYKVSRKVNLKIEEVDTREADEFWELLRKKRNLLLQSTDWTQIADCELETEQRKEYRAYRNYLRFLPKLHNNSSIISAKVYSFEDWKKGKR